MIEPLKALKPLTEAQWNEAFRKLEASSTSEENKAYYRRVWAFMREGRSYSFPERGTKK